MKRGILLPKVSNTATFVCNEKEVRRAGLSFGLVEPPYGSFARDASFAVHHQVNFPSILSPSFGLLFGENPCVSIGCGWPLATAFRMPPNGLVLCTAYTAVH